MKILKFLIIVTLIFSCSEPDMGTGPESYEYEIPEDLNDGWTVSNVSDEGIDKESIERLVSHTRQNLPSIDAIVIIKNGRLVLDEYFNGYSNKRLHELQSVTKTIDGLMVGLAIEEGFIESVDELIYPYFEEYQGIDWSQSKDQISIFHLLTMTTGLGCDEGAEGNCNSSILNQQSDWTKYTLSAPMRDTPGTVSSYFTGVNIVAHSLIEKTAKTSFEKFTEDYLFDPLVIADFNWGFSPSREALSLSLRPRDMAKIGQLFIGGGKWGGKQVVSKNWIDQSKVPHVKEFWGLDWHYGYWLLVSNPATYLNGVQVYAAKGAKGQYIFMIPEKQLVLGISGNMDGPEGTDILEKYVLKALN